MTEFSFWLLLFFNTRKLTRILFLNNNYTLRQAWARIKLISMFVSSFRLHTHTHKPQCSLLSAVLNHSNSYVYFSFHLILRKETKIDSLNRIENSFSLVEFLPLLQCSTWTSVKRGINISVAIIVAS